ncbi:MAG: acyl carrier protein [bacterium]|nr:acyl carrier protein [bacterium]
MYVDGISIKDELMEIVSTICGIEKKHIEESDEVFEIDSIKLLKIFDAIEEQFKISFEFEDMISIDSFNNLMVMVNNKIQANELYSNA